MPTERSSASYEAHAPRTQKVFVALMIGFTWCAETLEVVPPQTPGQLANMCRGPAKDATPSKETLRRWKKHFELYGELPHVTARYERLYGLRNRREARKVTPAVLKALKRAVDDHPEWYLDEMQDFVRSECGYAPSLASLSRALRLKMKCSLKVLTRRARQRDDALRAAYRVQLSAFSDPSVFVFVDETAKSRNDARRRRGWGPRGARVEIEDRFSEGGETRYSMIGAAVRLLLLTLVLLAPHSLNRAPSHPRTPPRARCLFAQDINGFIPNVSETFAAAGSRGSTAHESGTVDASVFEAWVLCNLCPTLGNFELGEPRSVVVMDNASIHCGSKVREMIEATGAVLIMSAPYSPDLNP